MKYWIFKAIWVPAAFIIFLCCFGIGVYLLKSVEWDQPFRWLCIISLIALIADNMVNP